MKLKFAYTPRYGHHRWTAENVPAKEICKISKRKTLAPEHLLALKRVGFELDLYSEGDYAIDPDHFFGIKKD